MMMAHRNRWSMAWESERHRGWWLTLSMALLGSLCGGGSHVTAEDEKNTSAPPGLTHDLRPHYVEGRTSKYEFWEKKTATIRMSGPWGENIVNTMMGSKGHLLWKVEQRREDGSGICFLAVQWIVATIEITSGEHSDRETIDTREETDEDIPMMRWLRALVFKPLRFEMNADGTVKSVSGVDAIREAMGKGDAAVDDVMFLEQASMLATIPGVGAALDLESVWENPNTWARTYGGLHGLLQETMRYQLRSVESVAGIPVATVIGEADLVFEPNGQEVPDGGPQVDTNMVESRSTLQIMFDLQRHEVVARNAVETVRIEMTASAKNVSITGVVEEKIHNQLLRIAEEDE